MASSPVITLLLLPVPVPRHTLIPPRPTASPFLSLLVSVWFESGWVQILAIFWCGCGCDFDEISPKRPDRTTPTSCPPQPNWSSHIRLQLKLQLQETGQHSPASSSRTGRPRGSLLLVVSQHMAQHGRLDTDSHGRNSLTTLSSLTWSRDEAKNNLGRY